MVAFGRSYHFIGIGGAGMSAIASVLLARGIEVSGSDLVPSVNTDRLARSGANIHIGHDADNVPDVDAVVVSSAIPDDNVEIIRAREMNIAVLQRMDVLSMIMNAGRGIGVAGTHGKTTTTSMVAWVLTRAGLDPTVLVGGELTDMEGNARCGTGDYVVAEVDESDGTFVQLSPYVGVVSNVEEDHLDHYGGRADIEAAFIEYLNRIQEQGFAVVCADDQFLSQFTGDRTISYGFGEADLRAHDVVVDEGTTFYRVSCGNGELAGQLRVPGNHNVLNALAALSVAEGLGLDLEQAIHALASFSGVGRRFETIARNDIWIVDDYAHHPTEVKAVLQAARSVWEGRIIAVFQPHRYSRTRILGEQFGCCFGLADELILTDVYGAGERPDPGVNGQVIAAAAVRHRDAVRYADTLDETVIMLQKMVKPGDLIMTIGAGNVRLVGTRLANLLGEEIMAGG